MAHRKGLVSLVQKKKERDLSFFKHVLKRVFFENNDKKKSILHIMITKEAFSHIDDHSVQIDSEIFSCSWTSCGFTDLVYGPLLVFPLHFGFSIKFWVLIISSVWKWLAQLYFLSSSVYLGFGLSLLGFRLDLQLGVVLWLGNHRILGYPYLLREFFLMIIADRFFSVPVSIKGPINNTWIFSCYLVDLPSISCSGLWVVDSLDMVGFFLSFLGW